MRFHNVLFTDNGNFVEINDISYLDGSTIKINDILPPSILRKGSVNFVGYFLVEEDNNDLSGIRRYLNISERRGKYLKLSYCDDISNTVREIHGDYVDLVSKYVGLRRVISSFNDLILENDINNNFSYWLEKTVENVPLDVRELIAQRITKFVNLYLIKIYEGIYKRNIDLLKRFESEIAFKILEAQLLQKTY
ncbi:hypothetical protein Pmob_1858 [Petrotoga mobilis SJ95]|jgi:hypothetical protein|uniref:Uncharacterized protein n=1 Tax=Petrotoga mobilis (strain DSM 10674 / SJ95) TaxID=403833 RepID=A9BGW6_PETMO|nr:MULTISPECIES: hypothetical protein [Petrotoga]MDK2812334.1 hypothetical protein [Petrotoga sp.]ABX32547.1 hypothetical protein Pmob_1858 [Petrotoga mobilis SJ95]MBL5982296.1 hypothetical protein [Petrotoga sp. 8T1HF07.NaAc.6.1]PNR89874.1 hypothetical protein X925_01375 [Petrotoga sp. 9T1HF07.CasAA.8.2]PNR92288.1 hypothetical protein X926_06515 [Petrotoga sp. HWHPT.55.6.3]